MKTEKVHTLDKMVMHDINFDFPEVLLQHASHNPVRLTSPKTPITWGYEKLLLRVQKASLH